MKNATLDCNEPITLIGAGGHCKSLVNCLIEVGIKKLYYHNDTKETWLDDCGAAYLSNREFLFQVEKKCQFVMAFIGNRPENLKKRFQEMKDLKSRGAKFPIVLHPEARVSKLSEIGMGVQVLAGASVNAFSKISCGVVLNTGSIIEHDANLGSGCHIAPGAIVLGGASIKDYCFVGAGAVVTNKRTLENSEFVKALKITS